MVTRTRTKWGGKRAGAGRPKRKKQYKVKVSKQMSYGSTRPYYIKRSTRTVNGYSQLSNLFGSDNFYALKFQLDDLPNPSEFQSLFDNYQIVCVYLKLIPVQNQMNIGASGAFEVPVIGYSWDYDDATAPTSMNSLRQYATYKEKAGNKQVRIKVWPKVSMLAYQAGVANAYMRPTSQLQKMLLIDCANPSVEHYGIKLGITNTNAPAGAVTYDIHATYYLRLSGLI